MDRKILIKFILLSFDVYEAFELFNMRRNVAFNRNDKLKFDLLKIRALNVEPTQLEN